MNITVLTEEGANHQGSVINAWALALIVRGGRAAEERHTHLA